VLEEHRLNEARKRFNDRLDPARRGLSSLQCPPAAATGRRSGPRA
jgi:hypothetical protein